MNNNRSAIFAALVLSLFLPFTSFSEEEKVSVQCQTQVDGETPVADEIQSELSSAPTETELLEDQTGELVEVAEAGAVEILEPISYTTEEAAERFRAFFGVINQRLLERGYLVDLISVALLAKEHVLIMGPPGNAKSMLSDEILGNILELGGENSYYRIQMTPETTMSETHGPINPKEILESGRIDRQYDQGILRYRNAFIDEIFDGRTNALRNILGVLAERQHAQGGHIQKGETETVVAATNKYIDQVYEKAGDDGPRAVLDRFAFNAYVPGEFEFADSYRALIQSAGVERPEIPEFGFAELDVLRELVKKVTIPDSVADMLSMISYQMKAEAEAMESASVRDYKKKLRDGGDPMPPYRSTKYHSPRTLFKAAAMLKALVVFDFTMNGAKRPLVANFNDLKKLESFFVLNGPDSEFVEDLIDRTTNPYERSQLSAIITEREMFQTIFKSIYEKVNSVVYRHALADLISLDFDDFESKSKAAKKRVYSKLVRGLAEIKLQITMTTVSQRQSQITAEDIGLSAMHDVLDQMLAQNFSDAEYAKGLDEIEAATALIIAEFEAAEKARVEHIEKLGESKSTLEAEITSLQGKRGEILASYEGSMKDVAQQEFRLILTGNGQGSLGAIPVKRLDGSWAVLVPEIADIFTSTPEALGNSEIIPNPKRVFGDNPEEEIKSLFSGAEGPIYASYEISENELDIVTGKYIYTINTETKEVVSQNRIAKNNALVHFDFHTENLYSVDFEKGVVLKRDVRTGKVKETKLVEFYSDSTESTADVLHKLFAAQLHKGKYSTYLSGGKLYSIAGDRTDIIVVDLKSGRASYFASGSLFNESSYALHSVDESGYIYGYRHDSNSKKSIVLYKIEINWDGAPKTQEVQQFSIKIDPESLGGNSNIIVNFVVDPTGTFAIVGEHNNANAEDRGLYLYRIESGDRVTEIPFVSPTLYPHFSWSLGKGLFFFGATEGGSRGMALEVISLGEVPGLSALSELDEDVNRIRGEISEIDTELKALVTDEASEDGKSETSQDEEKK